VSSLRRKIKVFIGKVWYIIVISTGIVNKYEKLSNFGHATKLNVKFNFSLAAKSDQDLDPHGLAFWIRTRICIEEKAGSGSALKAMHIHNTAIFLCS
jgi:hypothetical protein